MFCLFVFGSQVTQYVGNKKKMETKLTKNNKFLEINFNLCMRILHYILYIYYVYCILLYFMYIVIFWVKIPLKTWYRVERKAVVRITFLPA